MYVNLTRCAQMNFVPYLIIGSRVVVSKDNRAKITDRNLSLYDKKLPARAAASKRARHAKTIKKCLPASKPAINVLTYSAAADFTFAVAQSLADVEFLSTPPSVPLMTEKQGMFIAVVPEFEADTHIAFAI